MTKVKPAAERHDWLMRYIAQQRGGVDILSAEFVDCYQEATGAAVQYTPYGANRCRLLSRDLKALFDSRMVKRHKTPLPYDMRGLGFPLFVFNYTVHPVWAEHYKAKT